MLKVPTPEEIKRRRKEVGLSQAELARRAGVSQSLIAKIEAGKVNPRLSTIKKIVEALEKAERDKSTAKHIMTRDVIYVEPGEKVARAVELFVKYGISQLPVIKEGVCVGSIKESTILNALLARKGGNVFELKVGDVMEPPFPIVDEDAKVDDVYRLLLEGHSAILVRDKKGSICGIITKIDLITFERSRVLGH